METGLVTTCSLERDACTDYIGMRVQRKHCDFWRGTVRGVFWDSALIEWDNGAITQTFWRGLSFLA